MWLVRGATDGADTLEPMPTLYTVGHGTLAAREFAELLDAAGISEVVDVRRYPGSRRHPQFRREAMAAWLPEAGIGYRWMEALGGRRRASPQSANTGLRNEGFRGYADYMATAEFGHALESLLRAAAASATAVLCAESLWWRCHRRLIADAAVLLPDPATVGDGGWTVRHLDHSGRLHGHVPTDGAQRRGDRLLYAVGPPKAGL